MRSSMALAVAGLAVVALGGCAGRTVPAPQSSMGAPSARIVRSAPAPVATVRAPARGEVGHVRSVAVRPIAAPAARSGAASGSTGRAPAPPAPPSVTLLRGDRTSGGSAVPVSRSARVQPAVAAPAVAPAAAPAIAPEEEPALGNVFDSFEDDECCPGGCCGIP